ncbi:MAG: nitrite reductase small subunit NirD [Acidiferrobacteraceae bacterium]
MPRAANWCLVGSLADVPRLGARVVSCPDGDVALFRTRDDRVFAVRDRCPHRGGPLSQGLVCDDHVVCPLHNWCIDLRSGSAAAPDEGRVQTYPVRLEGDAILLAWPSEEDTRGD